LAGTESLVPAMEGVGTMKQNRRRHGAATVELAILAPFLAFVFVIAVDWARIFYDSIVVTNCARNGALYLSDPYTLTLSPYNDVKQAALADAQNLSPSPNVTSANGTDSSGPYVEVTVSYQFQTITNFPGVPANTNIVRTVRMSVAPQFPKQ
jgi:Flp pilus assembly protein TadG